MTVTRNLFVRGPCGRLGETLYRFQGEGGGHFGERICPQGRHGQGCNCPLQEWIELVRELRYQGNNLNQLTVMARQGRIRLVDLRPFLEVYQRTWQALNSLLSRVG